MGLLPCKEVLRLGVGEEDTGRSERTELAGEVGRDLSFREDGGHSVMDGGEHAVRLGGDHREAFAPLRLLSPDTRNPSDLLIGTGKTIRNHLPRNLHPLIKGGDGNKATALLKGFLPSTPVQLVLAGIDHCALFARLAGYWEAETPCHDLEGAVGHDDGRWQGRADNALFFRDQAGDGGRLRVVGITSPLLVADFIGGAHGATVADSGGGLKLWLDDITIRGKIETQ